MSLINQPHERLAVDCERKQLLPVSFIVHLKWRLRIRKRQQTLTESHLVTSLVQLLDDIALFAYDWWTFLYFYRTLNRDQTT